MDEHGPHGISPLVAHVYTVGFGNASQDPCRALHIKRLLSVFLFFSMHVVWCGQRDIEGPLF